MSYQVLARKWRPKTFESLVGQEHVVRALTHALNEQRLHHAYLFTNRRANRMKVLVHDGIGIWLAARRLHQGHFIWPHSHTARQLQISRLQFDALVLGLPWHRLGEAGIIRVL